MIHLKLLCEEPPTLAQIEFRPHETIQALLERLRGLSEPPENLALLREGVELNPRTLTLRESKVVDGAILHVICTRRTLTLRLARDAKRVVKPPEITPLKVREGATSEDDRLLVRFLPSFFPSFLPSFRPSFFPSFLPPFLPSFL